MRKNHLLAMMTENLITIGVHYVTPNTTLQNSGSIAKAYTFKTDDPTIKVGDFVAVPISNGVPKVCTVVEVHETPQIDTDSDIEYKWIYGKIDVSSYNKRAELEKEALAVLNAAERKRAAERAIQILREEVGESTVQKVQSFFNPTIALDKPKSAYGDEACSPK